MKTTLLAAFLCVLSAATHAEAPDRWFGDGQPWYQYPCGLAAFAKYGSDTRAEVRHNYTVARRDPAACARLFP
jgi:hypothetical protein